MTIDPSKLDVVRRYNVTTRATLREVTEPLNLLRTTTHDNPDADEEPGTIWDIWSHQIEDDQPLLTVGIRGQVGFLRWYTTHDTEHPAGIEFRDGHHEYWQGGQPQSCSEGEEIPIADVFAAVTDYLTTGQRPTNLTWVPASAVPDKRSQHATTGVAVPDAWLS